MRYEVEVNGRRRRVNVHRIDGRFAVEVDERTWMVDAARVDGSTLSLITRAAAPDAAPAPGGASHEVMLVPEAGAGTMTAYVHGLPAVVTLNGRRRSGHAAEGGAKSGPHRVLASMPGKVVRVLVKPGDLVRARQPVVVIEAMKMENELRSARDGRVAEVAVRDGQSVEAGVLLAVIADC